MTALPLLLLALTAQDSPEWGGFRGNNGTGIAESSAIPATLDPEENALWRVEVPPGYSSPVVAGDALFLTGVQGEELVTQCLERATGEERWTQVVEFDGKRVGMNSSAAPSPVTDGERIYATFHALGLIAYSVEGDELWRQEIGPFEIPHGMSTSPVVHGDVIVQLVDQDSSSFLAAYDKETGEARWRTERVGATHGYSTPAIYAPAEGPAQVVVSGALSAKGYSLEDGKELWSFRGLSWQPKCVPVIEGDRCYLSSYVMPTSELGLPSLRSTFADELAERDANGDGLIERGEWDSNMMQQVWFIFDLDGDERLDERDWSFLKEASRSSGGLFAIDLTGAGDVTESHLAWKYGDRRGLPDCASPLLWDGLLYLMSDGLMTAVDAESGETVKQGRIGESDSYFASPVVAGGRIVTAGQSGQLAVIEAGADWEVLSVTNLGEELWSTPAIADGQVFVRTQEALWCFGGLDD